MSDSPPDAISEKGGKASYEDNHGVPVQAGDRKVSVSSAVDYDRQNINAKISNPLGGLSERELRTMGSDYAKLHAIVEADDIRAFELGAILAQKPADYARIRDYVSDEEYGVLEKEFSSRWAQPKLLYLVIVLCSTCAAVQGMDETVVNGAQLFYTEQFGIADGSQRAEWLTGLVNSAPYLCCAVIGCWLTSPLNNAFGRRGTIFITCLFSALACFWQGFVNTWWHMFIARFFLGKCVF